MSRDGRRPRLSGRSAAVVRRRGATSTSSSTRSTRSSAARSRPTSGARFRLVRGTYGQRQDDVQMLRVKIPQGILDRPAARGARRRRRAATRAASATSPRGRTSSSTSCSCTTPSPRCGGSPRPGSPRARPAATRCATSPAARTRASSRDELFDVTPYAEALTRYFLRHPLSGVAAAQVQDRLRGLPRGPRASPRSTTSAGARASRRRPARAASA